MIKKFLILSFIVLKWVYPLDIGYLSSDFYTKDSIQFQITMKDSIYIPGDTLKITYLIKNDSSFPIFIFDPKAYILEPYYLYTPQKNGCFYKIELGGNWYLMLGYEQIISLQRIASKSQKKYILKLILTSDNTAESCFYDDFKWTKTPYNYHGVGLNIGYLYNNFEFIKRDSDMFDLNISTNQIGNLITNNLKRLKLGPLFYKKGYQK